MAITLITGPANAGKARAVLDAVRASAAREEEPLLVVPTQADVERYRRELAFDGLVWGVRVERFQGLHAEVVRRAGAATRPLTALMRERLLASVAARTSATPELATRPGLVHALAQLVAELEVERVTPRRLHAALAAWGAERSAAGATEASVGDLGALFERYHQLLRELGLADPDQRIVAALDAVRRSPSLWGGTPVHLYGFDDLTRLQLDTIETLGRVADAPLSVSLAYEAGRVAFAGRAGAFQTLLPWAAQHHALPARAEYYASGARSALHHLERRLFEPTESPRERERDGEGEPPDPARSVRLLEGGSPRAELELVAGEVKALLDAGMAPEEIAIVHRSPTAVAGLLAEVLRECEVPFVLPSRLPLRHTALGHALCGLLAAALEGQPGVGEHGGRQGSLEDLLAWLRAPGLLERPELADDLEAAARARGVTSAAAARALWESQRWPLETLDHMREAAQRGPLALLERTRGELQWLFAAPRRGRAEVLSSSQHDDARALAAVSRALSELAEIARAAPALAPNAGELLALLRGLELPAESAEDRPGGEHGTVHVLDPLALRARRVRALFLCGLQADAFPAPARPAPWLSEEERRGLAEASGLALRLPEPPLAAERYLFYATISRPEELLALSWHGAGEEGEPTAPSLFLEDVCDLFPPGLRRERVLRPAGAADWPGPGLPPASWRERELALSGPAREAPTLGPLADELLLAELREGRLWSASSLKNWMSCPARWFVESLLRARGIDPDAEPLARGGLAHAVLRDTLEDLKRDTGSARLSPARLERARALLHEALERNAPDFPLSVQPERVPGVRRRLEADLERYLEHACAQDLPLEPTWLELGFGFAEEESGLHALDLGEGVRVRGRIDRVDLDAAGQAVVYDYKGSHAPPPDKWLAEGHLQAAIYMRAVEQLLERRAVGGFYQPLAGRDLRARGVLIDDVDDGDRAPEGEDGVPEGGGVAPEGGGVTPEGAGVAVACVRGDARAAEDVQELLRDTLALAVAAAHEADAGLLAARPGTCAFGDGHCLYPSICRCER